MAHGRPQSAEALFILLEVMGEAGWSVTTLSQVQWGAIGQGILAIGLLKEAAHMGVASLVVAYDGLSY